MPLNSKQFRSISQKDYSLLGIVLLPSLFSMELTAWPVLQEITMFFTISPAMLPKMSAIYQLLPSAISTSQDQTTLSSQYRLLSMLLNCQSTLVPQQNLSTTAQSVLVVLLVSSMISRISAVTNLTWHRMLLP